jgi:hypothetical protein
LKVSGKQIISLSATLLVLGGLLYFAPIQRRELLYSTTTSSLSTYTSIISEIFSTVKYSYLTRTYTVETGNTEVIVDDRLDFCGIGPIEARIVGPIPGGVYKDVSAQQGDIIYIYVTGASRVSIKTSNRVVLSESGDPIELRYSPDRAGVYRIEIKFSSGSCAFLIKILKINQLGYGTESSVYTYASTETYTDIHSTLLSVQEYQTLTCTSTYRARLSNAAAYSYGLWAIGGLLLLITLVKSRRVPSVAVYRCPNCGTRNPIDAEYCMECGARRPSIGEGG